MYLVIGHLDSPHWISNCNCHLKSLRAVSCLYYFHTASLYEWQHEKTYFLICVLSKDSNQPAPLCCLIRVFDAAWRNFTSLAIQNVPIEESDQPACGAHVRRYIMGTNKVLFQQNKNQTMFFIFFHRNILCGYSLEVPRRGTSNEYPQNMFSWKNKKNIFLIRPLI